MTCAFHRFILLILGTFISFIYFYRGTGEKTSANHRLFLHEKTPVVFERSKFWYIWVHHALYWWKFIFQFTIRAIMLKLLTKIFRLRVIQFFLRRIFNFVLIWRLKLTQHLIIVLLLLLLFLQFDFQLLEIDTSGIFSELVDDCHRTLRNETSRFRKQRQSWLISYSWFCFQMLWKTVLYQTFCIWIEHLVVNFCNRHFLSHSILRFFSAHERIQG